MNRVGRGTMTKRLLLVAAALVALLAATAPPVAAEDGNRAREGTLLALGDSVAFGFDPLVPPAQARNAATFVGYPEIAARALRLRDTNASRPGEATAGLISL